MFKRKFLVPFVFMVAVLIFAERSVNAGETIAPGTVPFVVSAQDSSDDPFAEILKNNSMEVIQTGPSCHFIKVELPPGVGVEDIPGLSLP